MSHDGQLLADFVERAADGAFTELVRRHVNLVYATALRRLNGDTGTAADVTQQVFVALARQAGRLRREDSIAGWLHHHTLFEASKALRSEQRRRDREREFVTMNSTESPNALWAQVAPVLDDALDRLAAKDREALLLRFFENRDLRAVGLTLGVGEDAAQKRIARALEKLRGLLARRGVTLSAVALAGLMGQQATVAAPAAVVTSVCAASLAAAAAGSAAGSILAAKIATIMTTKTKIILAATVVAVGIATPLVQQHRLKQSLPNKPQSASSTSPVAPAEERRQAEAEMRNLESRLRQLQKRHGDLLRQHDQLEQANVALGEAGLKSEQARVAAEQNIEFFGKIAANLIAAEKLVMPKTMAEAALRAGQLGRKLTEFKESYLGKAAGEGTPEYAAYKQQMDALAAEFAPVLKALGGEDGNGVMRQIETPQGVSEFQSLMVYGALGLNDQQFQQVHSALSRYYAEGFAQKLDLQSRPETDVEAWVERRNALNTRAVTEVRRYLTTEQRTDFDKLIGKQLLWQINIGGGM